MQIYLISKKKNVHENNRKAEFWMFYLQNDKFLYIRKWYFGNKNTAVFGIIFHQ